MRQSLSSTVVVDRSTLLHHRLFLALPPTTIMFLSLIWRDTNGLTSENSELKLRLQTMEQQVHLQDALNDALKEEIQHLKVLTGQGMANDGSMMNFPSSYGANQQYFSNNHAMNTLLTAQQLQQLHLHSQKQQQHQFQQHQLHQFQQQHLQHQQEADMKLISSMQSSMEKDRASDSSSKD